MATLHHLATSIDGFTAQGRAGKGREGERGDNSVRIVADFLTRNSPSGGAHQAGRGTGFHWG